MYRIEAVSTAGVEVLETRSDLQIAEIVAGGFAEEAPADVRVRLIEVRDGRVVREVPLVAHQDDQDF